MPPHFYSQFPIFTSKNLHNNYVDCVRWVGDYILSKSVGDEALMWRPCLKRGDGGAVVVRRVSMPKMDVWYMRFCLNATCDVIAWGNTDGEVHHTDVDGAGSGHGGGNVIYKLQSPANKVIVRAVCFSRDMAHIVTCTDEGKLWLFSKSSSTLAQSGSKT